MSWIQNKKLNFARFRKRLELCEIENQFSNYGRNVQELERFLHRKLQISSDRSVIVCVNATAALHVLSLVLDTNNKGWATSAFTFPSSNCGELRNSEIIDIDDEGGPDLNLVKDKNLIITNLFGYLLNVPKYERFCAENDLKLILDNAATPYSFINGKNSLNFGDGAVISFHHTKLLGYSEGGAIICPEHIENKIRRLINFGFDNNRNYNPYGNNYKMNEITAAAILTFLEDNFKKILNHSRKMLKISRDVNCPQLYSFSNHIYPMCICFLNNNFNEQYLVKINKKVECKKYYKPLRELKKAVELYNKILCYPIHSDIKEFVFV